MDSVNKTLYIPLYGKAYVSRKGILLRDPKAEEIWTEAGFPLKEKSRSKWLAYYMGMRSAVFDCWLKAQMRYQPDAVVLHLGCGLDSRVERVGTQGHKWFDVDFPDVIAERKRFYQENDTYKILGGNIVDPDWLSRVPGGNAIVVMEGVSMYLTRSELQQTLTRLGAHFESVSLLMDCYTELAAKVSRYKNPVGDVGVTQVYGLDDPNVLDGMRFVAEHDMTPPELLDELRGLEKRIFKVLYAGGIAKKMYRLYEYRGGKI